MKNPVLVQEVVDLIREGLGCNTAEEDTFKPQFIDATAWTSKAVAQISPHLSMRPGSGIIHSLKATSTLMRAISGIRNLSVLEICSVLYSEWTGRDGVTKVGPSPGFKSFKVFLYGVSPDVVAQLQFALATKFQNRTGGKISTIYYPALITVSATTHTKNSVVVDKRRRVVQGDLNATRRLHFIRESDDHEDLADDRV